MAEDDSERVLVLLCHSFHRDDITAWWEDVTCDDLEYLRHSNPRINLGARHGADSKHFARFLELLDTEVADPEEQRVLRKYVFCDDTLEQFLAEYAAFLTRPAVADSNSEPDTEAVEATPPPSPTGHSPAKRARPEP